MSISPACGKSKALSRLLVALPRDLMEYQRVRGKYGEVAARFALPIETSREVSRTTKNISIWTGGMTFSRRCDVAESPIS
jgi:hypothetical protein